MVVYVANPLYDAVFKYLMEDERIAKTILTALLKKKVVDVKIRRNESNRKRLATSMCKITLQATILETSNDTPMCMNIELEKTWLETPSLSQRQHVAEQYNSYDNLVCLPNEKAEKTGLKIYILAHRIGYINAPIFYVKNQILYDSKHQKLSLSSPEPFVDTLRQDSIIIQTPLLTDEPESREEKILSLFCQKHTSPRSKQVLAIEEDDFKADVELDYIIYRLQAAACNPDMRSQMDTEDLYLPVLEDRDTQLMVLNHRLEYL